MQMLLSPQAPAVQLSQKPDRKKSLPKLAFIPDYSERVLMIFKALGGVVN